MTPIVLLRDVIVPALRLLGPPLATREAAVLLLAIALQESGLELKYRRQVLARRDPRTGQTTLLPVGRALSWWQIEPPTLVDCISRHARTREALAELGTLEEILADPNVVLRWSELSGAVVARGIMRLDPRPLPAVGDRPGGWAFYRGCWRPGKPRPKEWPAAYAAALEAYRQAPLGAPFSVEGAA